MKKMNDPERKETKKSEENKLTDEEDADFQFLLENDVRYSIISCIFILKEPLNLSKLSTLTGHPITTLIHHIPLMLEKNLIKTDKIPGKRGKFYNVTEKYLKIRKIKSSEAVIEDTRQKLDKSRNLSIPNFKMQHFKEMKKNFKTNKISANIADVIRNLGVFNNNVTKITSEFLLRSC